MDKIIKETVDKIRTLGVVDIYDGSVNRLSEWIEDAESFEAMSYGRGGSRWTQEQEDLFVEARDILTQIGHLSPGGCWILDHSKVIRKDNRWVIPVTEMRA